MKNIIIIICSIILPILSLKLKLCIKCKHFITDGHNGEYGKCSLFPKENNGNTISLVNGIIHHEPTEYFYCSTARSSANMCGEEGSKYEKESKINKNKHQ
jgi:hypothetical protein